MPEDGFSIVYAQKESIFFLKFLNEKARAQDCIHLKEVIHLLIERGLVKQIFFDLEKVNYMDSSFMGLLVGFHKELKAQKGLGLTLCRPQEKALNLLNELGIPQVIEIISTWPEENLVWKELHQKETHPIPLELLIQTHQNLSEISESNKAQFHDVVEIAQKQKMEELNKNS